MKQFKQGDQVILVRGGEIGGEQDDWTAAADLSMHDVYTVHGVDYNASPHPKLFLKLNAGEYEGDVWYFHPDHFDYYKKTNKQRIEERMRKQNE